MMLPCSVNTHGACRLPPRPLFEITVCDEFADAQGPRKHTPPLRRMLRGIRNTIEHAGRRSGAGAWTLLFPLTYALHVAEEYWGGESFWRWASRVSGVSLSEAEFVAINAVGLAVVTVVAFSAALSARVARVGVPALGTIVAVNGSLHLVASLVTTSYSPGVVTGLVLWLPLGVHALRRAWRELSGAEFAAGVLVGLAAHATVSLVAFFA